MSSRLRREQYVRLLSIVRCALTGYALDAALFEKMTDGEWLELLDVCCQQGICAVAFDAIELTPEVYRPNTDVLVEWFGQTSYLEQCYDFHLEAVNQLADFFKRHEIKVVLFKGYSLSLFYPTPKHRPTGDMDFFHCGQGESADRLVNEKLGVEVKQNEEKHSVYEYKGVHVENHATIVNELEHKSLSVVEKYLENELKEHSEYDEVSGCFMPSAMFNAVYLPLHIGSHFVFGETNLRQVIDYALMVNRQHQLIDWKKVKDLAIEGGYYQFMCCMNGICINELGLEPSYFPAWEYDIALKDRILNELLSPLTIDASSLLFKVKRFISNRWKYRMVYGNDCYFMGFFLRIRSWLIWKWGIGKDNIWK